MQLNGGVVKGIRGVRSFWVSILAIIFGFIFVGLGIYFFVADSKKTYENATATITECVTEEMGEEIIYHVTLKYTDKDGNEHSGITMDTYDSSWVVGKEIQIKYNVNDFNDVSTTTPAIVLPLLFIGLGAISAVVGVFGILKTIKQLTRKPNENAGKAVIASDFIENNVKDTKLFFHYSGKLNQSYTVEDRDGKVHFECKLLKFNPIGASLYEFIDVTTSDKKQMKIGKTITSSSSGGLPIVGEVLGSSFKIDGVNCWDYVASKGYEIKHLLEGKTIIKYEVIKDQETVAKILPANMKDPFNENSVNFLRMGKGIYRLEINDANLPDIVMIAFIIGRTEIVE